MRRGHATAVGLAAWIVVAGIGASASPAPAPADAPVNPVARLGWLAGCWERANATRVTHEQWMAPLGGIMLGMSRTVRDGRLVEYEQVGIEWRDSVLVFTARPSRQSEASFPHTELTDSSVTFTNPEHDFPQVIRYTLRGDSLLAQIEGSSGGKTRVVDFHYRRVACPGR